MESLNVSMVRSKLGIVSQEPVLFDRTLAENIKVREKLLAEVNLVYRVSRK